FGLSVAANSFWFNRGSPELCGAYFSAWAFSSSSVTNSSAEACVASRSTGAARLWSSALFHRVTHTHHLSPGLSPGKPYSGTGVTRSFPSSTEKSKNSRVTFTQTVCCPTSSGPVRQKPSRKNPVIGSRQQHFNSVPKTFVGIRKFGRTLLLCHVERSQTSSFLL